LGYRGVVVAGFAVLFTYMAFNVADQVLLASGLHGAFGWNATLVAIVTAFLAATALNEPGLARRHRPRARRDLVRHRSEHLHQRLGYRGRSGAELAHADAVPAGTVDRAEPGGLLLRPPRALRDHRHLPAGRGLRRPGLDYSWVVGLLVSGLVYLVLSRSLDLAAEQAAISASEQELLTIDEGTS
jgi:hypothetical protein